MDNFTGVISNSTLHNDDVGSIFVFKFVFTFVLAGIMFGMGCAVDYRKLKENLQRPVGLIIGLICQIILMPVLTYITIKIFALTPVQSLALALIGLSPGGSNSNVVTYLVNGDISLSVVMTTCSNIIALATVPIWIFAYTAIEKMEDDLKIDYNSLLITLLSIAIPVAAGIFFKYKFPKKARLIPKISAAIAMLVLVILVVVMVVVVKIPLVFTANTVAPSSLLPFAGMGVAYLISMIPVFDLHDKARKAIAIETGIQNAGISNSVLILSFGHRLEIYSNAVTIPLIYNISQSVLVLLLVVGYQVTSRIRNNSFDETESECKEKSITHHSNEKEPLESLVWKSETDEV